MSEFVLVCNARLNPRASSRDVGTAGGVGPRQLAPSLLAYNAARELVRRKKAGAKASGPEQTGARLIAMMLDSIQQKLQSLEDNIAASKHTNAELASKLRSLQVCTYIPALARPCHLLADTAARRLCHIADTTARGLLTES